MNQAKLSRRLIEVICDAAQVDHMAVYNVLLSTGTVIKGQLSPLDAESDHIRVNPVGDGFSHYVALAHVVSFQQVPKD